LGETKNHDGSVHVRETDILCPDAPPVRRERRKIVFVEYYDPPPTKRDTLKAAPKTMLLSNKKTKRFERGSAIILQHLIDALEGRGVCNKRN